MSVFPKTVELHMPINIRYLLQSPIPEGETSELKKPIGIDIRCNPMTDAELAALDIPEITLVQQDDPAFRITDLEHSVVISSDSVFYFVDDAITDLRNALVANSRASLGEIPYQELSVDNFEQSIGRVRSFIEHETDVAKTRRDKTYEEEIRDLYGYFTRVSALVPIYRWAAELGKFISRLDRISQVGAKKTEILVHHIYEASATNMPMLESMRSGKFTVSQDGNKFKSPFPLL